jgi:hypothetical protein
MTFVPYLRFRAAAPLLIAIALLACTRANADAADHLAASPKAGQSKPARSMHSGVPACEIDQTSPRSDNPPEARVLPVERTRPMILDGVMYLDNTPRSGAVGVGKTVSQCSVHPKMWTLGVIPGRIAAPRYY